MTPLTENTIAKFSIGLLITIMSGLVALTAWLVTLSGHTSANTERVSIVERKQDQYQKDISDVKQGIAKIEGQMDILIKRKASKHDD